MLANGILKGGFRVGNRRTGAYATTKFAIVALSETLATELEDTHITVTIVAPSGVNSNFYLSSAASRGDIGGTNDFTETPDDNKAGMHPDEVARRILTGLQQNRLYVFTHARARASLMARFDRITADFDAAETI